MKKRIIQRVKTSPKGRARSFSYYGPLTVIRFTFPFLHLRNILVFLFLTHRRRQITGILIHGA